MSNRPIGWKQVSYDSLPGVQAAATPKPEVIPQPLSNPMPQPLPTPAPQPIPAIPVIPMPPPCMENMVLAMAYVKKQAWSELYEADMGLQRGTIFPELDLPFVGEGACPHDE